MSSDEVRDLKKQIAELAEQNDSIQLRVEEMERMHLRLTQPLAPCDVADITDREEKILLVYIRKGHCGARAAEVLGLSGGYVRSIIRRPRCRAWLKQLRRATEFQFILRHVRRLDC